MAKALRCVVLCSHVLPPSGVQDGGTGWDETAFLSWCIDSLLQYSFSHRVIFSTIQCDATPRHASNSIQRSDTNPVICVFRQPFPQQASIFRRVP
ncbi:hypothetical protein E2C01_038227 [Portunus trituberculatus]|uniref:Uncharacterized protein n=1 Tax=Portunus trituberculatus TaxID=210409 RepID=A0A5B7FDL7_PORTR|nr:hypothetical protein [Portunus trituberculatus]